VLTRAARRHQRSGKGEPLVHAIQALHGQRIVLPRQQVYRPDEDLLEVRYRRFREAS